MYVLAGPGGTGKTQWALAYFARKARTPEEYLALREKMLFLTCTGTNLPDVSKYVYGKHQGIVYDEGTPEMVWDNREIFQGLAEKCTVGDTHTHMYAREVCVTGCLQVITCNDWWERLEQLEPVRQEWLRANVIVGYVPQPLYTDVDLYEWNAMGWSQSQ